MIRLKKIEHSLKKYFPRLRTAFRNEPDIVALFLFGSYVKNMVRPLSDIDIAVLLKIAHPQSSLWERKISLLSKAVKILKTEEIDLVILNEAPIELRYNILKTARTLFCSNEKERIEFLERCIRQYLATQNLRQEIYFHLRQRLINGRFASDSGRHQEDFAGVRRILARAA